MSTFTTPIKLEILNDGKTFKLTESFEYHIGNFPSNDIIIVPEGFVTDLMTVPRLVLPFFNPMLPQYSKPSLLHDWLYDTKSGPAFSRKKSDDIFLEAMEVLGVSRVKRVAIYFAVRCFAKNRYNKTRTI